MKIRAPMLSDAAAIAELGLELGYPLDEASVRARLVRLQPREDELVLVVVEDEKIVGWMQAHASLPLESGFRVEILGLIISQRFRRRGIGRCLVARAEHWARKIGAERVTVRSNTQREESHRFYPALGYTIAKTQAVYRKDLAEQPADLNATPVSP